MKQASIAVLVLTIALTAGGRPQNYDLSTWDCELLKDNLVNVDTKDAVRRATKKVIPDPPGDVTTRDALVTVAIVVDAKGWVQCIHAKQGHPLLITRAIQAAKDWRFKPYIVKGHALPFETDLTFRFTRQTVRIE